MSVARRVVWDEKVGTKERILVELDEKTEDGFERLVKEWETLGWKLFVEEKRGFTIIKTREDRVRWSIKIGLVTLEREAGERLLADTIAFGER